MAGVNKVIIIGHLGQDVDLRTMQNGTPVANMSVATSEKWIDKQTNEQREVTEWHRIVLYRRLAEIAGEYLRKGSKVYVEGKLKTRKWKDQGGIERYTTEIIADSLQMLDSKQQNTQQQAPRQQQQQQQKAKPKAKANEWVNPEENYYDDDIPF